MLRKWNLQLSLDRGGGLPVHLQIAQRISADIQRGRLPPGAPLPGSRELAAQLGVNRKTAVLAYEELAAQGWLLTQGRRGTFVAPSLPLLSPRPAPAAARTPTSVPANDAIDFGDGVPDSRLIPFDVLGRAYRRALIAAARAGRLAYGDPRGELPLRQALAEMLDMERGLDADAERICLVRGSQMGIYLAGRALLRPGDAVALDALSYPPAREAFRSLGARPLDVELDAAGMRPDALERLCRTQPVKAVYLTPHHQYPTTLMMPAERRLQLLALSRRYGFAIIEDDYDHEFHFSRSPALPMASLDAAERIVYVGSLSKVLAPGLRVGYLVAEPAIIERCAADIMLIDRQGNAVTELAVAELMHSGELKRHLRRALRVYRARRQALADAIDRHLAGLADYDLPEGGLALWLRLPSWVDMPRLCADAQNAGARVLPGGAFAGDGRDIPALRLGFGALEPAQLEQGVARLARALRRQIPAAGLRTS
ncbi:PLP-dependent aminotransferase family protein [Chromobacterium alkanivorans]|uniref:MocR-like pyridoxine biosynthesis transcription factor PdxR n=1 Tax=Chromobacterium alkanivorans TaxID=1071719 RepID=UPI001967F572|nr:PLP-dependent aminotransferase family protein [Chromobacterium alkanivorans]MBN3004656.1 PLP-dependent aminotransferase family protein [Chromobacterium alkanivorans]